MRAAVYKANHAPCSMTAFFLSAPSNPSNGGISTHTTCFSFPLAIVSTCPGVWVTTRAPHRSATAPARLEKGFEALRGTYGSSRVDAAMLSVCARELEGGRLRRSEACN